jgi:hypothetical protein
MCVFSLDQRGPAWIELSLIVLSAMGRGEACLVWRVLGYCDGFPFLAKCQAAIAKPLPTKALCL